MICIIPPYNRKGWKKILKGSKQMKFELWEKLNRKKYKHHWGTRDPGKSSNEQLTEEDIIVRND